METDAPGRPRSGFGHYLRDMVYGALDGVITTLAVVSGASGAQLEPRVGLILGLANLTADGLSIGASSYLGLRSELEQTGRSMRDEKPWRHGLATSAAFVAVGAAPLFAYAIPPPEGTGTFHVAAVLAAITLAVVGALRARYVRKAAWKSAAEMIAMGAAASGAAYVIGAAVERLTR
jgi:VIT1/CCC1 family predicted Fe2+/Mn2+ transporter